MKKYYATHDGIFLGKHHSEETKKKMSESKLGKSFSNIHKNHLRESHIGLHHSNQVKQKISETLKQKDVSIGFCKRVPIYCIELNMRFCSKKSAFRYLKEKKLISCSYDKFCSDIRKQKTINKKFTFREA